MVIRNDSNGAILTEHAIRAESFRQKTLGLIFAKHPTAMIFQTRFGIHTFFMKYPIDVVVLDNQNKIVALKKDLMPNRIFLWNIKYETIIELPAGAINKTKTDIGDDLTVIAKP